jgi:hypothetical protein
MAGLLQPIIVRKPFYIVGIDFFGPLPCIKSKNEWILSFTDHLTKYVELFPLQRVTEKEEAKYFIKNTIAHHDVINSLISDRGANFVSHTINEVYKLF